VERRRTVVASAIADRFRVSGRVRSVRRKTVPGKDFREGTGSREDIMLRSVGFLAMLLFLGSPLRAGELDVEYASRSASQGKAVNPTMTTAAWPTHADIDRSKVAMATELDAETPTQAMRGGGGGGGGGFGGGRGGGFGRGYGGYGGYGRGYGGYGGFGYGGYGFWPYYGYGGLGYGLGLGYGMRLGYGGYGYDGLGYGGYGGRGYGGYGYGGYGYRGRGYGGYYTRAYASPHFGYGYRCGCW
jgi:hypothetical protein